MKSWIRDTVIRAIKTAAETAVGLIGTNVIGVTEVDWLAVASAALLSAVTCVLINIANFPTDKLDEEDKGDDK